jgi:hypothetical protein
MSDASSFPDAYYEDIRGRLKAVLFTVAPHISRATFAFVSEELDANELGLSLETLVDALVEVEAPVTRSTVETLVELADRMRIDHGIAAALEPFIVDAGTV